MILVFTGHDSHCGQVASGRISSVLLAKPSCRIYHANDVLQIFGYKSSCFCRQSAFPEQCLSSARWLDFKYCIIYHWLVLCTLILTHTKDIIQLLKSCLITSELLMCTPNPCRWVLLADENSQVKAFFCYSGWPPRGFGRTVHKVLETYKPTSVAYGHILCLYSKHSRQNRSPKSA